MNRTAGKHPSARGDRRPAEIIPPAPSGAAESSSDSRASTQRALSGVALRFQNGARPSGKSMMKCAGGKASPRWY